MGLRNAAFHTEQATVHPSGLHHAEAIPGDNVSDQSITRERVAAIS
jgi:hypothetical protein